MPDLVVALDGQQVETDEQLEGGLGVRVTGDPRVVRLDAARGDDDLVELRGARLEDRTVLWAELRHPTSPSTCPRIGSWHTTERHETRTVVPGGPGLVREVVWGLVRGLAGP